MYTTGPHTPHCTTSTLTCFGSRNHSLCASNSQTEPPTRIAMTAIFRMVSHSVLPRCGFPDVSPKGVTAAIGSGLGGRRTKPWAGGELRVSTGCYDMGAPHDETSR